MRLFFPSTLAIALLAVSFLAGAATYQVGPSREHKSLKALAANLQPGDVVEIDPGTYREVLRLTCNGTPSAPIIIRGVGAERPLFDGEGLDVSGRGSIPRAIFEVAGAYIIVEHLEFKSARNGNNGAGIRLLNSTNAVIRDCKVTYCDMGIFGGDRQTALIESCEVAFNGTPKFNGYSHNFYMHGNRVVVRACHIHDSIHGQNYKSRAHYNELWYNWIADSNEGEVGPVDGKGETDRPNSNVLMVGNIVVSKPNRTGNRGKFILMGSELGGSHDGTLYMFHNTLVAGNPRIQFVQLDDPKSRAVLKGNIFYGSDRIAASSRGAAPAAGSHNWVPKSAGLTGEFSETLRGETPGFLDLAGRDFRLRPDSPCVNRGPEVLEYVDGNGMKQTVKLDCCYGPHRTLLPRSVTGAPDIGAYELGAKFLPPPAH
ncbi:MAG: right-handed parallel beta-helix repeat-containing protein [Candidatus Sumerlaeia bacterium]|nr:right-handed parallel beta-helix repeat-containing protein [Candidatus Sumerlaeia bacterium]